MFIRKRRSGRKRDSYQVLESYRDGGATKHRVICNLGSFPTVEEALAWEQRHLDGLLAEIENPPRRYLTGRSIAPTDMARQQLRALPQFRK